MHESCTVCGSREARVFGSLVTIPSLGIYDVGSDCGCLSVSLAGHVTVRPPDPIEPRLAGRLLSLSIRAASGARP